MSKKQTKTKSLCIKEIQIHVRLRCALFLFAFQLPKVRKINANFTVAVGILKHYGWKIKLKSCLTACDKSIKTATSFYLVFPFMGLYPRVVKM